MYTLILAGDTTNFSYLWGVAVITQREAENFAMSKGTGKGGSITGWKSKTVVNLFNLPKP